jgi:hypothetical protein
MPLIVLLDADVMREVDQVDGGVMVGESLQGRKEYRRSIVEDPCGTCCLGKIPLLPAVLMRNPW